MKNNLIRTFAVSMLSVAMIALASCNDKEKPTPRPTPPEPVPDGDITELFVDGTSAAVLGDENQKLTYKGENIFNYSGVLTPGELYFSGKDKDDEDVVLKKGDGNSYTLSGGENYDVDARGWYNIDINVEDATCQITLVAELGDLLTMLGNTSGSYDPVLSGAYLKNTETNPFVYKCSRKYYTDGAGDVFRFCVGTTNGEDGLIMKEDGKETLICFADNQAAFDAGYKSNATGTFDNDTNKTDKGNFVFGREQNEYTCTVDLISKTVTFEAINNFYPEYVTDLWLLVKDNWTWTTDKEYPKMERNGNVFSVVDFETTGGNMFFGLTANCWRPGLFKDPNDETKAVYPTGAGNDGGLWALTPGTYDISIDIGTSIVTIDKHDGPVPTGDIVSLAVAGTAASGLTLPDFVFEGEDVFNYSGVLAPGTLYFTGKDSNDTDIELKEGEAGKYTLTGGTDITITDRAWYSIDINTADETVSVETVAVFGDMLTLIGNAAGAWDPGQGVYLYNSVEQPFIYIAHRVLWGDSGALYSLVVNMSDQDGVLVPEPGSETIACFANAASRAENPAYANNNWVVPAEDDYKITVNLITKTITLTPESYYPTHVGDVYIALIPDGKGKPWTLPSPPDFPQDSWPKMTRTNDVFTFTGEMVKGTFYFPLTKNVWRPAIVKADDTSDASYTPTSYGKIDSNRWTIEEDGNYTVTLSIDTSAVTITKN